MQGAIQVLSFTLPNLVYLLILYVKVVQIIQQLQYCHIILNCVDNDGAWPHRKK